MARVPRPVTGSIRRLRRALLEHFDESPLKAIGEEVNRQLDDLEEACGLEGANHQSLREFFRQYHSLLHVIPAASKISDRFWFDVEMIRAIAQEWAHPQPRLPGSVCPRAASEWQYAGIHIPSFTSSKLPRIDVIDFPGDDDPEGINLLSYPWLYHELGHLLLVLHGKSFLDSVGMLLDQIICQRAKQRLGKAPAVQDRLQKLQTEVERTWRPSPNHTDWSHEIAADMVALWSCGPAFIAAYEDSLEGQMPHIVNGVHPPYEIRTIAIVEAARRLGWTNHTKELESTLEMWTNADSSERDDVFVCLSSRELVHGVLAAALGTCKELQLPRCDASTLSDVENLTARQKPYLWGRSLILASWLTYERFCDHVRRYHKWERDTVNAIIQEITP